MADWRHLHVEGLGPIARVAAVFQVGPPLAHLPFASFKVKVLERADGSFLGVANVAVKATDGQPDWRAGLGVAVEEALEDALRSLLESLDGRTDLTEEAFEWADAMEF